MLEVCPAEYYLTLDSQDIDFLFFPQLLTKITCFPKSTSVVPGEVAWLRIIKNSVIMMSGRVNQECHPSLLVEGLATSM